MNIQNSQDNINLKQIIIKNGDLTINWRSGLSTALAGKQSTITTATDLYINSITIDQKLQTL